MVLRKEVLEFYEKNNIPIKKMIEVGVKRKGLTRASVEMGADKVYDDIKSGALQVDPIQIGWEVFAMARRMRNFAEEQERQLETELNKTREELRLSQRPFWKKWWGIDK